MRDKFIKLLQNKISDNSKVILLTADLGFGVFDCFEKYRNQQYFNVGVCEQLMASIATGMALEGFEIYIYSIGVFPTLRCLEQIRNDITYHECNVNIITSGAGFSYGSLGMSHHCIEDLGFVSSIPGIEIFTPSNNLEMELSFNDKAKCKYIRIDKSYLNLDPIDFDYSNNLICYHKNNSSKVLVLFHGSIGNIAEPLFCKDYQFDLYSVFHLKESQDLLELISKYTRVITIEEHSIRNGFGSFVSLIITQNSLDVELKIMAIAPKHHSIVGSQSYLRNYCNLTSDILESLL